MRLLHAHAHARVASYARVARGYEPRHSRAQADLRWVTSWVHTQLRDELRDELSSHGHVHGFTNMHGIADQPAMPEAATAALHLPLRLRSCLRTRKPVCPRVLPWRVPCEPRPGRRLPIAREESASVPLHVFGDEYHNRQLKIWRHRSSRQQSSCEHGGRRLREAYNPDASSSACCSRYHSRISRASASSRSTGGDAGAAAHNGLSTVPPMLVSSNAQKAVSRPSPTLPSLNLLLPPLSLLLLLLLGSGHSRISRASASISFACC